ncbi:hypothetical protein D3C76_894330 [compost metagenome]
MFSSTVVDDLRDLGLWFSVGLNDQFTVLILHDRIRSRSTRIVQRLSQFLFFLNHQVFSTGLFTSLLFLLMLFFSFSSVIGCGGLLLSFNLLSTHCCNWVGLVNDLGQELQETQLHDFRVKALRSFHRRERHVGIKSVIIQGFHGNEAMVGALKVELFAHGLFRERFHRHACTLFTPAIQQAKVEADPTSIFTDDQFDLTQTGFIQAGHRREVTALAQPHEEVEQVQTLTTVEYLHQRRSHAPFSFTQVRQRWQRLRHIEQDDVMSLVRSLELVETFPLGSPEVTPVPPTTQCRPLVLVHVPNHGVVDYEHVQGFFSY